MTWQSLNSVKPFRDMLRNEMEKQGYVYILTNYTNSALYVGVTSNLIARIYQHKEGFCEGFTKKYHVSSSIMKWHKILGKQLFERNNSKQDHEKIN